MNNSYRPTATVLLLLAILAGCTSTDERSNTTACPAGQKRCDAQCVSASDPALGCTSAACTPCALSQASARCGHTGGCVVDACAAGFADCDSEPGNGCETNLRDSTAHCGACGTSCTKDQVCRASSCLSTDLARTEDWLAAQRGGWCNAEFNQILTLCNNTKYTGTDSEFCFDETLLNVYPDGIEVTIGFHWAGDAHGLLFDVGGDCTPGPRVSAGITPAGRLFATGPGVAGNLETELSPGTHLTTYRSDTRTASLFLDGVLVASGAGTGGTTPELATDCGPGIVLGQRISYWWESTPAAKGQWARFAPFFFHLRDADRDHDPKRFSFDGATAVGPRTRILFDASGVEGTTWNAKNRAHKGYARNGSQWVEDGLACLTAKK